MKGVYEDFHALRLRKNKANQSQSKPIKANMSMSYRMKWIVERKSGVMAN